VPLRIALDATPLLGTRTGVGRYVDRLVQALTDDPSLQLTLTAFTARGAGALSAAAPPQVRTLHRPVPARALQALWSRTSLPPVELLTGRCEVFHATNFVLPPARRAAGVVTVHDLAFDLHADTVNPAVLRYRTLVPRSVRRAALVLCPARATAAEVAAHYGLDDDRVVATPLGVDAAWAEPSPLTPSLRQRLGLPERYLLFVGTREPRKQLPVLLAAHAAARAEGADVPALVLAGPAGWGAPTDLPPGVVLAGWLADDDLHAVVGAAQALVLVSRYEGFGLPLLEALAAGTAVVASDLPVHREVTGGHGILVPVGDVDALAAALVEVVQDPATPKAVEQRKAWAAGWTWQECARRTAEAYRRAAA
jgi:glycosyltransferase involved in cell wall biosynthesis